MARPKDTRNISEANRNRVWTKGMRQQVADRFLGTKHSERTKHKISRSALRSWKLSGRKRNFSLKNPMRKRLARAKVSKIQKRLWRNPEYKKWRVSMRDYRSPSYRKKLRDSWTSERRAGSAKWMASRKKEMKYWKLAEWQTAARLRKEGWNVIRGCTLDLFCFRKKKSLSVKFVEVKTGKSKPTITQLEAIRALGKCGISVEIARKEGR